jgi:hypothetical protein
VVVKDIAAFPFEFAALEVDEVAAGEDFSRE